ncbi:hypothetical protein Cni_G16352 [Canna indica]|uniref:CCHC-type domain-containing protein n=1 Tax=Canna indica TaxID=4628 RepID=A0AAQ3KF01_9LILI|nr:hypothetical protein Cni_G16352 [Canna indica]
MGSPKVKMKPVEVSVGKNYSDLLPRVGASPRVADPKKTGVSTGNRPLVPGQSSTKPNPPSSPVNRQDLVKSKPNHDLSKISWASLFKLNVSDSRAFSSSKASSLDFVKFNENELKELRQPWFCSLISRFLHRSPPHFQIRDWAMSIWSMYNISNVIDLENGFFLFRFPSEVDAIKVLTNDPWAFRGDLINFRPWKPDFKALTEEISYALVWIQFPDLPMEYWQNSSLFKIASTVGKPIKVEENSFSWQRGKFVCICVELDFSKPLKQGSWIGHPGNGLFQAIWYERLLVFCFKCGIIGHLAKDCNVKHVFASTVDMNNANVENSIPDNNVTLFDNPLAKSNSDDSNIYGPWIKVGRRGRAPNKPRFVDPYNIPTSPISSIPDYYGRNSPAMSNLSLDGEDEDNTSQNPITMAEDSAQNIRNELPLSPIKDSSEPIDASLINHGYAVSSIGASGGLLFAWKSPSINAHVVSRSKNLLNAVIQCGNDKPWLFSGLYADTNPVLSNFAFKIFGLNILKWLKSLRKIGI